MPLDRSRTWDDRMWQARKFHLHRLKMLVHQTSPRYLALMANAAATVKAKMPGWTLPPPPGREEILADYRRVIRRNLWTRGKLP